MSDTEPTVWPTQDSYVSGPGSTSNRIKFNTGCADPVHGTQTYTNEAAGEEDEFPHCAYCGDGLSYVTLWDLQVSLRAGLKPWYDPKGPPPDSKERGYFDSIDTNIPWCAECGNLPGYVPQDFALNTSPPSSITQLRIATERPSRKHRPKKLS